jgi:PKD repeat protein
MKNQKNTFFCFAVILLIAFSGCIKEPVANFDASKTTVVTGEEIVFTNTTVDAESYEWDFGDGEESIRESPSHVYTNPGVYDVTLKAYSKKEKKSDEASMTITVKEANQIVFNGTKYPLSKGYLEYYGDWAGSGTYNFDITLVSDGLTLTQDGMTGYGNFVYVESWSSTPSTLTTGSYTYGTSYYASTYSTWLFGYDYDAGTDTGTVWNCSGGSMTISINGTIYTIDMDLVAGENTVNIHYEGTMTLYDYTKKGLHKNVKNLNSIHLQ